MSRQQKPTKSLKQQVLEELEAQRDTIGVLSDQELESVAGGAATTLSMGPTSVNTGAAAPNIANIVKQLEHSNYGLDTPTTVSHYQYGPLTNSELKQFQNENR